MVNQLGAADWVRDIIIQIADFTEFLITDKLNNPMVNNRGAKQEVIDTINDGDWDDGKRLITDILY
jgi:hypothetical protein